MKGFIIKFHILIIPNKKQLEFEHVRRAFYGSGYIDRIGISKTLELSFNF